MWTCCPVRRRFIIVRTPTADVNLLSGEEAVYNRPHPHRRCELVVRWGGGFIIVRTPAADVNLLSGEEAVLSPERRFIIVHIPTPQKWTYMLSGEEAVYERPCPHRIWGLVVQRKSGVDWSCEGRFMDLLTRRFIIVQSLRAMTEMGFWFGNVRTYRGWTLDRTDESDDLVSRKCDRTKDNINDM